uniref:Titin n=1 Tax=Romanomermis culicivorax TaxID=13658 RepID=A0A915KHC4_ROMCU
EPGKPGRPQVVDWDKDRIDLQWTPPANDGGAPITGYVVERKDPTTKEWVKVMETKEPKASIKNLKEGHEYQFRVKAVNKAGPGHPSDPSDKQIAKSRYVPPWLDLKGVDHLIVKAGKPAKFDVKIGGEPAPDVFWSKSGQLIKPSEKITIDTKKTEKSVLTILTTVRGDCGKYTIKVKNNLGEKEAVIELTVLDRPTAPKGPLLVEDVYEDNCVLEWQPPDDLGGEDLDFYEVEKMDTSTGRWMPAGKTKDTKFKVDGLKKGQSYQFRVKAVNKEGTSDPLITEKATVAKNPYDEPGKAGQPDVVDWDKDRVELEWKAPESDGGSPITGYIVEKKARRDKNWSKALEIHEPVNRTTVKGLKENDEYQFRIRAVNIAGPGEPSDPSKKVICKPRNCKFFGIVTYMKPYIERDYMKPITIKVGQNVEFDVPVRGEPPPEKVWSFKGTDIVSSDRVKVTQEDYKIHIILRSATRQDAGKYTLTATNASGKDVADTDVLVLDSQT